MVRLNAGGRAIELDALEQRRTYGGLVEGLPTEEGNRRTIASWVDESSARWSLPVHLVTPTEEPIEWTGSRPYPFGVPSALPQVQVRARFRSSSIGEPDPLRYSSLTIVWFQAAWALPIDPAVEVEIRAIDWEDIAADLLM